MITSKSSPHFIDNLDSSTLNIISGFECAETEEHYKLSKGDFLPILELNNNVEVQQTHRGLIKKNVHIPQNN